MLLTSPDVVQCHINGGKSLWEYLAYSSTVPPMKPYLCSSSWAMTKDFPSVSVYHVGLQCVILGLLGAKDVEKFDNCMVRWLVNGVCFERHLWTSRAADVV